MKRNTTINVVYVFSIIRDTAAHISATLHNRHQCRNLQYNSLSSQVPHLQQAVPHKPHKQLVSPHLMCSTRVLCREHGREVEHGNVRMAVVVHCKVQVRHLVVGGVVGGLPGIGLKGLAVHVVGVQQLLGVHQVLRARYG